MGSILQLMTETTIDRVRKFVQEPPKILLAHEAEFSELHAIIREPMSVTSEDMEGLIAEGKVERFDKMDQLLELMDGVKFTGTDIPLFECCGTLAMIEKSTGTIFFGEKKGEIHDRTTIDKDGNIVPLFPGGLTRYAVHKMITAATLQELGSDPTMEDEEDLQYIGDIAKTRGLHMGQNSFVTDDGRRYDVGVSGADMTHETLELVTQKLELFGFTDEEYTIAGKVDSIVASWAARLAAGETVTTKQAQEEWDGFWSQLLTDLKSGKKFSSHFH